LVKVINCFLLNAAQQLLKFLLVNNHVRNMCEFVIQQNVPVCAISQRFKLKCIIYIPKDVHSLLYNATLVFHCFKI